MCYALISRGVFVQGVPEKMLSTLLLQRFRDDAVEVVEAVISFGDVGHFSMFYDFYSTVLNKHEMHLIVHYRWFRRLLDNSPINQLAVTDWSTRRQDDLRTSQLAD